LVIVGGGSQRSKLEKKARDLGLLGVVEFAGVVSEKEKVALLRRASVVVNTSEKEGWGLTVIEGNAFGVPSVSSDVPGLRDSVKDGRTGLLYPCRDTKALARKVVRVMTEPDFRGRLTVEAIAWASTFNWERAAQETLAMLEAAVGSRPSAGEATHDRA